MPLTAILMLLPADEATLALGRYDAMMKASPAIRAELKIKVSESSKQYVVDYTVSRSKRHRLDATAPGITFSMSQTERGRVDLDRLEFMYDEFPIVPGRGMIPSRVTDQLRFFFPSFLNVRSGRDWFPRNAKLEYRRQNGKDYITSKSKDTDVEIELKPNGHPVRFYRVDRGPMGSMSSLYLFKSWKAVPDNLSAFRLPIPNGYSPLSVPDTGDAVYVGNQVKLGKWRSGGKTTDVDALAKQNGVLVVFSDPFGVQQPLIDKWLSRIAKSRTPVLRLADATSAPSGWFTDPSGQFLSSVNPSASPYIVFVDKKGAIKFHWMGLASDTLPKLVSETNAALKSSK